jgi:hypothetical protein
VSHIQDWSSIPSYDAPSVILTLYHYFLYQHRQKSTALCLTTSHTLRNRYRWKDNMKNDFRETGWDGAVTQH